ncbi:MAG TPA: DUF433 domain-containing protein [Ignavibacteria bacterium]|nr:hypothetical protein [Bacteroidota bacterium]HRI84055.1 DUF433 domain-containing protein [Ignavibacteria bacterium]HRK00382.1 DUF433 domain-containing protein [Ignavibacteria bacterium]
MDYTKYISIDPNIRFGKPCIRGTRISVYDVFGWFASGMTTEQIIEDFPQLSKEQILACLAYSADKERKVRVAI